MSEYKIYMGLDSYNILTAVMQGDNKMVAELQAKFAKDRTDRTEREYAWLKTNLLPEIFDAFAEIDKTYKRHIGWTDDARFMGSRYKYNWNAKDVQIDYNDYGKFDLMISFRKEKFGLYVYYSDDSGYDQGKYNIETDIEPTKIVERISDLRNRVLSGFKICV
jgi:hypothetical protein